MEEAIRQQYAQAPKVFDLNAVEANVKAKNDNRRGAYLFMLAF